jgi:peptide/nickel transport system substrate-binding protein
MRFARPAMKIAALAAIGATALAACGKSSGSGNIALGPQGAFGKVPAKTGTPHAGTVTVAAPPSTAPTWILPIITAADNSVYTVLAFDYQMWRPLYWFVNGVEPSEVKSMSLANDPVYSNGDKTVTITLKSNYKWSDGQPVTSKDIAFWWAEMKAAIKISPANWAYYTPGLGVPDDVASIATPSSSTFVMHLKKAVNPTWFTEDEIGAIQPMPAHAWAKDSANGPILNFNNAADAKKIYNWLAGQSKPSASWATDPTWQVVDGPYKLTQFNVTTGAFTMAPNSAYAGPHAKIYPTLQSVPFTSDDAEVNALKSNSSTAPDVGYVPQTNFKDIPGIKTDGYNVFGYPDFGWNYVAYNFKDTTGDFNHLIGQLYIRQAIAHLEDEAGYIKAFYFGAGGQAFGPVPEIPKSPYTPADALKNPYPFSVSAASSLLKAHGWKVVPGGTDTCAKAGTAATECGAGIPAGTKLAFPLVYNTTPATTGEMMTNLASEAAKAGIQIHLSSNNFNYMVENFNDPAAPKNDDKWAAEDFGGFTDSTDPTTFGVFNSTGSSNLGGYDDPKADQLITASISSSDASAVKSEASYLTQQQPGLFEPNPDLIQVWKKTLSSISPIAFENLTQYGLTPEFWYFTK